MILLQYPYIKALLTEGGASLPGTSGEGVTMGEGEEVEKTETSEI